MDFQSPRGILSNTQSFLPQGSLNVKLFSTSGKSFTGNKELSDLKKKNHKEVPDHMEATYLCLSSEISMKDEFCLLCVNISRATQVNLVSK